MYLRNTNKQRSHWFGRVCFALNDSSLACLLGKLLVVEKISFDTTKITRAKQRDSCARLKKRSSRGGEGKSGAVNKPCELGDKI